MPTYDYKCLKCGYLFELFQKITDEPLRDCPVCEGQVKRLIGSGLAPILKGSGFYQTDYKNTKSDSAGKSNAPKTETKPDSSK